MKSIFFNKFIIFGGFFVISFTSPFFSTEAWALGGAKIESEVAVDRVHSAKLLPNRVLIGSTFDLDVAMTSTMGPSSDVTVFVQFSAADHPTVPGFSSVEVPLVRENSHHRVRVGPFSLEGWGLKSGDEVEYLTTVIYTFDGRKLSYNSVGFFVATDGIVDKIILPDPIPVPTIGGKFP